MRRPAIWFDPMPKRWRRVLAVAVAAVVAVQALMLSSPTSSPTPPALATAVVATPLPPVPSDARASAVTARVAVMAPRTAGEVEICGGARAKLDERGELENAQALTAALTLEARRRTLAAMSASTDPLARGAALYVAAERSDSRPTSGDGTQESRDALARLASASSDARLYALAMHACASAAPAQEGACRMLSAAQWARLDPHNAVPWMFVADAAASRGEAPAVEEAMQRIARAGRSDAGERLVPTMVLAHAPDGDAQLAGSVHLMQEIIAMQAAWSVPRSTVAQFCDDVPLQEATRRQTCGDIAEVLATKSINLLDQRLGADIGKRLGWAEARNASLMAERDAIGVGVASSLRVGGATLGCEWAQRNLAYLREVALYGTLGAGRRVVERPREPPGESDKGEALARAPSTVPSR